MLLRMYLNWAKDHDYETELLDRQDNEQAGINTRWSPSAGRWPTDT